MKDMLSQAGVYIAALAISVLTWAATVWLTVWLVKLLW